MTKPKRAARAVATTEPAPNVLNMADLKGKLDPATYEKTDRAAKAWLKRGAPLDAKITETGHKSWKYNFEGSDNAQAASSIRMMNALGSNSAGFVNTSMAHLLRLWNANGGVTEGQYNAALAVLETAQPQNELEAMLVVQMIAAHESAMRSTAMIANAFDADQMNTFGNLANKFMRTFTAQMEALSKMRRGGEQVIKYVHVHEGGQAVIGSTINQGVGGKQENDGQSQGTGTPEASAALPGPDPARDGVPIPSDAERAMSPTRGNQSGGAEG